MPLTLGAAMPYMAVIATIFFFGDVQPIWGNPMHSVLETSIFTRRADALMTRDERARLIETLASDPQAGDLVPGLGGIRKLRFAAGGQGKRGALRVIYYVSGPDVPILALLVYGKNEQANPTAAQRRAMVALVEQIKEAGRRKSA
jgi:hypothetical protein